MSSLPNALKNKLARSRASIERSKRPINNETFARLYSTRPSSPNSLSNSASVNSQNSESTWGSFNRGAWKMEQEQEKAEREAKQAKIAAFLAKAKSGLATKKANRSWIKKNQPTVGGRKKTRRCGWWKRRNTRRSRR